MCVIQKNNVRIHYLLSHTLAVFWSCQILQNCSVAFSSWSIVLLCISIYSDAIRLFLLFWCVSLLSSHLTYMRLRAVCGCITSLHTSALLLVVSVEYISLALPDCLLAFRHADVPNVLTQILLCRWRWDLSMMWWFMTVLEEAVYLQRVQVVVRSFRAPRACPSKMSLYVFVSC